MQGLRIDLTQIRTAEATDDQPITLHYGHHNPTHRRTSSHPTSAQSYTTYIAASTRELTRCKHSRVRQTAMGYLRLQQVESKMEQQVAATKGLAFYSILSVREIKEADKKATLKEAAQRADKAKSGGVERQKGSADLARIELGGKNKRSEQNRKMQLLKALQKQAETIS